MTAAALPNPVAEASVQFGHDSPKVELGVMEDLTEFIFYSASRGAADARLNARVYATAAVLLETAFEARAALIELQATLSMLSLQQKAMAAAFATFDAARRLRDAGNITELALGRHQAVCENSRLQTASLESEAFALRQRLANALGLSAHWHELQVSENLAEELPDFENRPNLTPMALERSLQLKALEHEYEADARSANLYKARGWFPEPKAGALAEREEGEWSVGPAVELSLPLFYQGQGEVAAAQASMRAVRSRYAAAAANVRTMAAIAFERVAAARARVVHFERTVLPLQLKLLEQAELQYNAMSLGVFELLATQREWLQAKQQSIEALKDFWLAQTQLELLLAGGVPGAGGNSSRDAERSGSAGQPAGEH